MPDIDQQVHYTSLTSRESEVLELVATGLSNQQIADVLVITIHTVKEHLKNIFTKLDVNKRTMAVARAREIGLVSDDDVEANTDNFPKGNLPHLIMPLIGRDEGTQLLAKSDVRLITIHSPGGVGKTHFALEMAHQQQTNFKDGVYFVPVASLTSSVFFAVGSRPHP